LPGFCHHPVGLAQGCQESLSCGKTQNFRTEGNTGFRTCPLLDHVDTLQAEIRVCRAGFSPLLDWLQTSVQDIVFPKKTSRGHSKASQILTAGLLAVMLIAIGCQSTPKTTFSTERPSLHSVTTGHFVINSDVHLDRDNVLVKVLCDSSSGKLALIHAQIETLSPRYFSKYLHPTFA
jgi:hypothetical protein